MKNFLVADRYASGLSRAIADDAQLEPTLAKLEEINEVVSGSNELRNALSNPSIEPRTRLQVIDELLAKLDCTPALERFMRMVVLRGRTACLPDIVEVFNDKVSARLNRVVARVTFAQEPTAEQLDRLRKGLEQYSGKTVNIRKRINPGILGGVVAEIGGRIIDGSLRARLRHLRERIIAEES